MFRSHGHVSIDQLHTKLGFGLAERRWLLVQACCSCYRRVQGEGDMTSANKVTPEEKVGSPLSEGQGTYGRLAGDLTGRDESMAMADTIESGGSGGD